jgi:hypothetical protein
VSYENAVLLIPGFFGFGRLGNFYYFADRVAACLRGAAETAFGIPTPVMGVSTVPAGSLAERQKFLLSKMTHADRTLGRPARYHLVGHSAGGVDAELLRAESPLENTPWTDIDPDGVRPRIATITTISSPHYGTYLADSGVVSLLRDPLHHLTSVPQASVIFLQLAKLAIERPVVHQALIAGVQGWSDSARFVVSLLTDEKLLKDLRPDSMEKTRQERPPVLQVPVTCFVTAIPAKPVVNEGKVRKPDELIECLERLTGDVRGSLPRPALENLRVLNAFSGPVVRNPAAEVPAFGGSTSDGVVNAVTQILRSPGARTGGIVLADHGDVIGHYDRQDPLTSGTPINDGFFRSGSGFGDDQFFALYREVSKAFHARFEAKP